jgi:hypothetical protein
MCYVLYIILSFFNIVLTILLQFTASDYPFGIFKLFLTLKKIYAPSSSLLQGKHLHFSPSALRLNIFRLFVILSLTQLYRYTPEIFLFPTAIFKYTYLRQIGQE